MPQQNDQRVLEALLDSWARGNTILVNLLRALPPGGLEASAMAGSLSVAVQFSHVHHTRLYFLHQIAPELAANLEPLFRKDGEDRIAERDPERIARALNASAQAVGQAVNTSLETGQTLKGDHVTYDHPVLFLQHMLWHEGYHVGQIKLALKTLGFTMSEEQEEETIWGVWRTETW
jgi:uncharacterized damage-inducible protein DinB